MARSVICLSGNRQVGVSLEKGKRDHQRFAGFAAWTAAAKMTFLFPTRPSFSTAHRKRSFGLSHIRKTLSPGVPVVPLTSFFGSRWAVAYVLRGSLAYRGFHALLSFRPLHRPRNLLKRLQNPGAGKAARRNSKLIQKAAILF